VFCIEYIHIIYRGIIVILGTDDRSEDQGLSSFSASPCVSWEASEWDGRSDETGKNEAPCRSRCGTIKSLPAQRSWAPCIGLNFAAIHQQWWRLHDWKILERDVNQQIINHVLRHTPLSILIIAEIDSHLRYLLILTEIYPRHSSQGDFQNLEHHTMPINIKWYICITYYQGMIRIYFAMRYFCLCESKLLSILQRVSKYLNKLEG
jgi:hypothetical protein